jgi:hypothetical protein
VCSDTRIAIVALAILRMALEVYISIPEHKDPSRILNVRIWARITRSCKLNDSTSQIPTWTNWLTHGSSDRLKQHYSCIMNNWGHEFTMYWPRSNSCLTPNSTYRRWSSYHVTTPLFHRFHFWA